MAARGGFRRGAALCALLACARGPAALAAQEPRKLADSAEFAYNQTSGNSDTRSLQASNTLRVHLEPYALMLKGGGFWSKFGRTTTSEWFNADLRLDRRLGGPLYVYGLGTWDKNRFAAVNNRFSGNAGPGLVLLNTTRQTLRVEPGLGYFTERRVTGQTVDSWQARGALDYSLRLSETAQAGSELEAFQSLRDHGDPRLRSVSFLAFALTRCMGVKWSYTYLYRGNPAGGFRKIDRIMSTGLYVNFE